LHADLPAMRCVGYRQAWSFLEGDCNEAVLREQGVAATRQLAKRQLTWLRSMPQVLTIDCLREDLQAVATDWVERFFQYGAEPITAEASDR